MKYLILVCAGVLLAAGAAMATDEMPMDHSQMHHEQAASPADEALMAAHKTMMDNMHVSMTGNPDVDFVTMMIPHHRGAVDMCKVQLQYGSDAEIKKLCEGVIAAQEKEITQMQDWLKAHAKQ